MSASTPGAKGGNVRRVASLCAAGVLLGALVGLGGVASASVSSAHAATASSSAVPGKPGKPVATAEFKKAYVSWAKDAKANGATITKYVVKSSTGHYTCSSAPLPLPSCTVAGLVDGHTYTFTVRARNAKGTSVASVPSNAVKPGIEKPAKPAAPVASIGNYAATLTWSAATAEGSPVTRYVAASTTGHHFCSWGGGPLTCRINDLTNGQSYKFDVVAHNAKGTSPSSPYSTPLVPGLKLTTLLLDLSELPSGFAEATTPAATSLCVVKAFDPVGVEKTESSTVTFEDQTATTGGDVFEYMGTYVTTPATVFKEVVAAVLACPPSQATQTGVTVKVAAPTPVSLQTFGQQSEAFIQTATITSSSFNVTLSEYQIVVRSGTVLIGIITDGLTITTIQQEAARAVGNLPWP